MASGGLKDRMQARLSILCDWVWDERWVSRRRWSNFPNLGQKLRNEAFRCLMLLWLLLLSLSLLLLFEGFFCCLKSRMSNPEFMLLVIRSWLHILFFPGTSFRTGLLLSWCSQNNSVASSPGYESSKLKPCCSGSWITVKLEKKEH